MRGIDEASTDEFKFFILHYQVKLPSIVLDLQRLPRPDEYLKQDFVLSLRRAFCVKNKKHKLA